MLVGVPSKVTIHNRAAAATAYAKYLEDNAKGLAMFRRERIGDFGKGNEVRTMKRWGKAREERASYTDAPRSGPPRKISFAQVIIVLRAFLLGYLVAMPHTDAPDLVRHFMSLKHAVESKKSEEINTVMRDTGISVFQCWKRLTQVCPELRKMRRRVDVKCLLSQRTRLLRMKAATELLKMSNKQLDSVVWIDAKKLHVDIGNWLVYTLDPHEVLEDERLPQGKFGPGITLHYYAAVNSLSGVVSLVWVTGTTKLGGNYVTKVMPPPASQVPPNALTAHDC